MEDTVIVNVFSLPVAEIIPSVITIYEGEIIYLQLSQQYENYEWYNSNDSLLSVFSELSVEEAGEYYVFVIDENNCVDTSSLAIVTTVPLTEIFIPNTFTPNGDYHNEQFSVYGSNIIAFDMKIANRWGTIIYETSNMEKCWDGRFEGSLVPEGIYFYTIDLVGADQKSITKLGTVQIIY